MLLIPTHTFQKQSFFKAHYHRMRFILTLLFEAKSDIWANDEKALDLNCEKFCNYLTGSFLNLLKDQSVIFLLQLLQNHPFSMAKFWGPPFKKNLLNPKTNHPNSINNSLGLSLISILSLHIESQLSALQIDSNIFTVSLPPFKSN